MDWEVVHSYIDDFGYIGLFLWLWFGLYIFPVPSEILVMGTGLLTNELLSTIPAFVAAYFGFFASMTTSYWVGRMSDVVFFRKIQHKKGYIKASEIIDKHGVQALWFSPYFPGVRHAVPILCGIRKISFFQFVKITAISSFIWCSCFFTVGKFFVHEGLESLNTKNIEYVPIIVTIILIITTIKIFRVTINKKKKRTNLSS